METRWYKSSKFLLGHYVELDGELLICTALSRGETPIAQETVRYQSRPGLLHLPGIKHGFDSRPVHSRLS